jgi:hypothetical protein
MMLEHEQQAITLIASHLLVHHQLDYEQLLHLVQQAVQAPPK